MVLNFGLEHLSLSVSFRRLDAMAHDLKISEHWFLQESSIAYSTYPYSGWSSDWDSGCGDCFSDYVSSKARGTSVVDVHDDPTSWDTGQR